MTHDEIDNDDFPQVIEDDDEEHKQAEENTFNVGKDNVAKALFKLSDMIDIAGEVNG